MVFNIPHALTSTYSTSYPNEEVFLYQSASIDIIYGEVTERNTGSVSFDWLPTPRVKFECSSNTARLLVLPDDLHLSIPGQVAPVAVILTGANAFPIKLSGIIKGLLTQQSAQNLTCVLFHLVNFYNFEGLWISSSSASWSGRAVLRANNWQVTIDRIEKFSDMEKSLEASGGYAITHVGKVERIDRSEFTPQEAKKLLDGLHYFFSFARGIWSTPIIPVGFDANGTKVWESWYASNVDSWRLVLSWFNQEHQSLTDLFPGFLNTWQDPNLQEPIKIAIHWYVESCKMVAAVGGSIVLEQVALEMLSWVEVVERENAFTNDAFDKLPAFKKIEKLLKVCKIPICVPAIYLL